MKGITISSRDYRQQLIDLYYGDVREYVTHEGERGGSFFFTFNGEFMDVCAVAELFEDIILGRNEALANSPKLYETVRDLVFAGERDRMTRELEEYFQSNRELCVEGYLNFRLAEAARKVSRVLYALAKKLHFTGYGIGEAYDY